MKAVVYTGVREVAVREFPRVEPPPGYVLIATRRAGICGSDLHTYLGHWPAWEKLAPGHELAGVVAAVGADVVDWHVGDRVTVECGAWCGVCDQCRTGRYNLCRQRRWFAGDGHGAMAEYTTAHVSTLVRLPDALSFEDGAMVEPLAVGVRAVAQAALHPGESLGILGGGTIGLCCLMAAVGQGVRDVLMAARYDHQARVAADCGARVCREGRDDLAAAAREFSAGQGLAAVIDTVGSAASFADGLGWLRPAGRLVLVAGYPQAVAVSLGQVVWREVTVVGANCYAWSNGRRDSATAVDLIVSGRAPVNRLVTHRFPLTAAAEAFRVAADKATGAIKVQLTMDVHGD